MVRRRPRAARPARAAARVREGSPWLRRVAVALLALSLLAVLVDLARPSWVAPVRALAADAVTPVQEALVLPGTERVRELTRERDQLRAELQRQEDAAALLAQAEGLMGAAGDRDLLPARVIGTAAVGSPLASRTLTLDVGAVDGVEADQAVVTGDGLVGRVVEVYRRSSDVRLLGDPDVVVGVRVGGDDDGDGALGTVTGTAPAGVPARGQGQLSLTLVGESAVEPGDAVTTLGSPDGRPYVPGVALGTVVSVDPERGQVGRTAVVEPTVDPATLDLVGVVLTPPREDARDPLEDTP